MDYSERLIVNGLKAGDTEAYRYVYDTHYRVLCYTADRYVHDHFVAETIVGDLIFRLWERRATLDINTSLRTYLLQGVRHACIDYLRSKRQRCEVAVSRLDGQDLLPEPVDQAEASPLEAVIGNEFEERVAEAFAALPPESRRVFEMSRCMGKKYAEIADELGISVSTVKYHIRNVLKLLSEDLGRFAVVALFAWI